ncbi:MAG TPA: hypothetical protein EYP88_05640 [Anaerolineales bacterium]|nr:hypothetical protein [Anaerolineales bacterium]
MLSSRKIKLLMLASSLFLLTLACNMPGREAAPTEDPGAVYTVAAQTLEAQLTQVPGETILPPPPTASATPPSPAPPTNPPPTTAPPDTAIPPTPTTKPLPCDRIKFVEDVTIDDGTEIAAGEPFEKIWRLKNVGTCTWDSGYDLVFDSGDQMSAPASQQLTTGTVAPGQEIDVSVTLTAPDDPGKYRAYFKLRNGDNVVFGLGDKNKPFWVEIKVPDVSGVMFDFLARASDADWGSGVEPVDFAGPGHASIPYGGPDNDANGFVMIKDAVLLENGSTSGKILETHPKWENNGYVVGQYPEYKIGPGDHITGRIGFIAKADGTCGVGNVIFEIHYIEGNDLGTRTRIGKWSKPCNGNLQSIDVDLASLKGKTVRFFLVVRANGDSAQDWAIWSSLGVMR